MTSPARILPVLLLLTTAGACGGDDTTSDEVASTDSVSDRPANDPPATDESVADDRNEPAAGEDSDVAVPIARFTAHGPQEPNTIAPACADGPESDHTEMFRFTPPESWTWRGFSGGTGSDEVEFETAEDVRFWVTEAATASERPLELETVGPTGTDLDLDGAAIPLIEVVMDGRSGYAIVDLPYLEPFPVTGGAALGTVALTSDVPDRPTLAEAVEFLSTVRIERCEAVALSLIYGPAVGVNLVPRFEPDPLAKPYPDQPQPAWIPGEPPLETYSLEQIAYLMPVEADRAACAAERARALADDPLSHLLMLRPTGTFKDDFNEIIAGC